MFGDESKRRGFVMAVASVRASHVEAYRRQLVANHVKPGARRFHCTGETNQDRRNFVDAVSQWPAQIDIFVSGLSRESEARAQTIAAVAAHAANSTANRLVIEADSSHNRSDRRVLTETMRQQNRPVAWDVLNPYQDALLWVPDAAAWCWTHPQAHWRRLIEPLIRSVTQL